jgi:lysozyme
MNNDFANKIINILSRHEGYKSYPYFCTKGVLTIGYGHNLNYGLSQNVLISLLTEKGLNEKLAKQQLIEDIKYFTDSLSKHKFYKNLNESRQIAIINMCFSLGVKGLLTFKKMIAALEKKDFKNAKEEILNSNWAKDVRETRSNWIAEVVEHGVLKP